MLDRGFSLFEMLLSIIITSVLMLGVMAFYPNFYVMLTKNYFTQKLEKATDQALSRLIKDIKRAGFNLSDNASNKAIKIDQLGQEIVLFYDQKLKNDASIRKEDTHSVFAYRYYNYNLESHTGEASFVNNMTRWDKLFDPSEFKVTYFHLEKIKNVIKIAVEVQLLKYSEINYKAVFYVKNENE